MVKPFDKGAVRSKLGEREGFVVPIVIFALVLTSVLAVAALVTADDTRRSSRAMLESSWALYAAEAGLNATLAAWDDTLVSGLQPGDSVDLGWRTMENGASYRVVIHRFDMAGELIYTLTSQGRSGGPLGGQRTIEYTLRGVNAPICCSSAVIGGGRPGAVEPGHEEVELDSAGLGGVVVNGMDTVPATWGSACASGPDLPGLQWRDTTPGVVEIKNGAVVAGNPPIVENPAIDSTTLFDWGRFNYDSLVARADAVLPPLVNDITVGPVTGPTPGTCDTSVATNWGAPLDPSSPCYDYFPIIHAPGNLEIEGPTPGAGQGILLVDGNLEIEQDFQFYGIIIVMGKVEFEHNVQIYGGVIAGSKLEVEDGASVRFSQCAVDRALKNNGLMITKSLADRSWVEVIR